MSKTYNETRYTLKYTETNDKQEQVDSFKVLTEKQANEELEAAKAAGTPGPEVVKMQTFGYVEAESPADFETLIANEVERVNVFNRGYVLKQQSIIRDFMLDNEQQATDGVYDLTADAAEVRERRKATPAEKAMKALSALSADEIAKILSQFTAAQSA
jgi:hypothetical protein